MRGSAAFFCITLGTGTNNICPTRLAAQRPRDNMVERKLICLVFLTAILTAVVVAGINISTVKFHFVSGQTVIRQQPNNSWNSDIKIHGRNPVIPVRLEVSTQLTYFAPRLEIVIRIAVVI